jgi:tryptophan-rich sensory protein
MLLLFSTLGLSALIFWQKSLQQHLAWLAGLVFFVYLYNVAGCLEVAIVNSLEVRRYLTMQMVFTLFAQFLALWLVIEFVQEKRAHHST